MFISGPAGTGKSAFIRHYLGSRVYYYHSCLKQWKKLVIPEQGRQKRLVIHVFDDLQASMEDTQMQRLMEISVGNGFGVNAAAQELAQGTDFDSLLEKNVRIYVEHAITEVIPGFGPQLREFIAKISVVEEFDISLACAVTGAADVESLIRKAEETGSFLSRTSNGWKVRKPADAAFREYAVHTLSDPYPVTYRGKCRHRLLI